MNNVNGSTNGNASLSGKTALVTGAARGIGHAIALELAARGADVAVNYHASREPAEELAAAVRAMGRRSIVVHGEVGDPVDARALVKSVLDEWGHIDILVNNAGITRDHSIRKLTDEEWHEVIRSAGANAHPDEPHRAKLPDRASGDSRRKFVHDAHSGRSRIRPILSRTGSTIFHSLR